MSLTGLGAAHVPFGTYDVTISRGPEGDIATIRKVKIGAAGAVVSARLSHGVDTTGWGSADFHVHAARSTDSRVPMQHRIFEFVADDVQMIVATDHNVVSDYDPFIRELGVGPYITSAIGDELTTGSWGHFGAFPLPAELEPAGQGAVLLHGPRPDDIIPDTLVLMFNFGGYPRNYVKVLDDQPAVVSGKEVAHAVKAHRSFFTTGPFVSLLVNGGTMGDLVPARGGKARADITVQAAPWVSVDHVQLIVGGKPLKRWDSPRDVAPGATEAVRFHQAFDFEVKADSYVLVRVDGEKSLTPVVGDRKTFTAYPFALTNPVFLDADGDGKYTTGAPHGHAVT